MGQQGEEDRQRQLEDLRHRGNTVFGQRHAQVLLDGIGKHFVSAEDWAGTLQQGKQQLQGDNLGAQLMGPGRRNSQRSLHEYTNKEQELLQKKGHLLWVRRSISQRFHGELAQRAEHQESIFLQDVGEACGVLWPLQGFCILKQWKKVSPTTQKEAF